MVVIYHYKRPIPCAFADIAQQVIANGIQAMRLDGSGKVRQGLTTLDEVVGVTTTD